MTPVARSGQFMDLSGQPSTSYPENTPHSPTHSKYVSADTEPGSLQICISTHNANLALIWLNEIFIARIVEEWLVYKEFWFFGSPGKSPAYAYVLYTYLLFRFTAYVFRRYAYLTYLFISYTYVTDRYLGYGYTRYRYVGYVYVGYRYDLYRYIRYVYIGESPPLVKSFTNSWRFLITKFTVFSQSMCYHCVS